MAAIVERDGWLLLWDEMGGCYCGTRCVAAIVEKMVAAIMDERGALVRSRDESRLHLR